MTRIYVDHAATTPMHDDVLDAMLPYLKNDFGNPSSIHQFGRETRAALDEARRSLANHLGAKPSELVFTSGGTEADNMALFGIANAHKSKGRHVITTQVEHHAVLYACEQLEEMGFEVTYLPVNHEGRVTRDILEKHLRDDTILVSMMYGNNEVGTLQPLAEIGDMLQERDIVFHTDAVQAFGIEEVNVKTLGVDLLSISGHKINGPKGIGCLYVKANTKLQPIFYGGSQERNRRAGTENIAAIVGLAKAAEVSYEALAEKRKHLFQLRERLIQGLQEADVSFIVNGDSEHTLPHILNVSFIGVKADAMLMNLDIAGIAASSGSACSAGSLRPSHVLEAMNVGESRVESAIRFSFGFNNTEADVDEIVKQVQAIYQRLLHTNSDNGGDQG
ncbi:cysteine desulfurase family protein [Caldalkalibacillus salinus]|uniref:cysteine desulfurase family protein n=1 Tax=Caldalkalibacillus salinus TaxID=2803787 RepID=UPI0019223CBB|nr:cysteine desulfurase family protein [Caldalkalibacillus salinus]